MSITNINVPVRMDIEVSIAKSWTDAIEDHVIMVEVVFRKVTTSNVIACLDIVVCSVKNWITVYQTLV